MNENYIVINGKKTELTTEQLMQLGIEVKKENPYQCDTGYNIYFGKKAHTWIGGPINSKNGEFTKDRCQSFVSQKFARQTYLREFLERKLRAYSYKHGLEAHMCEHPFIYIYINLIPLCIVMISRCLTQC